MSFCPVLLKLHTPPTQQQQQQQTKDWPLTFWETTETACWFLQRQQKHTHIYSYKHTYRHTHTHTKPHFPSLKMEVKTRPTLVLSVLKKSLGNSTRSCTFTRRKKVKRILALVLTFEVTLGGTRRCQASKYVRELVQKLDYYTLVRILISAWACPGTSFAPWTLVLWVWWVSILEVQTLCEEFAVKWDDKKRLFYTWPADFWYSVF